MLMLMLMLMLMFLMMIIDFFFVILAFSKGYMNSNTANPSMHPIDS